ncbi:MAG TPA: hypothetical protein VKD00_01430, partial [Methyloceanibacter sp.]|nr:hypothetical protein [Methyloceanibacter sp.]
PNLSPTMDADPALPLVLIEWLDSGQPVPGWQWLEAIELRRPHLCVSVSFLMQDYASAKVLAPSGPATAAATGPGLRRDHHPGLGGQADAGRFASGRYARQWRYLASGGVSPAAARHP